MSDDADPGEQGDEQGEQPDQQADTSSETSQNPPVEEGEMADFAAVAEEIEESSQTEQESPQGGDDSDDDQEAEPPERNVDPADSNISIGTVYTNALGMSAAVARGRYGTLDDDRDDVADEYAAMARQIQLDEYMDQWVAEQGGLDGLSPGEAVLLGTLMWGGMMMLQDPAMAEGVLSEVRA